MQDSSKGVWLKMQLRPVSSLRSGRAFSSRLPNRVAAKTRFLRAIALRSSGNSVEVDQDGSFFAGFDSPSGECASASWGLLPLGAASPSTAVLPAVEGGGVVSAPHADSAGAPA